MSGTQRSYHSPQRDESARATRARIVTAAHSLFLEHGFASTSVADIAAASGVARPTVLTVFGTKARLLRTVVDVAMAGNDEPVPVPLQPWFQPVWQATTAGGCLDAPRQVAQADGVGRRHLPPRQQRLLGFGVGDGAHAAAKFRAKRARLERALPLCERRQHVE